ncbi:four-helix bundle copper-binding protein [Scopulibacillus cellulosilyticus]|uniref:Four-helix bundle copper-binding protein n=1 Tax=Scopulibacillus cellulosilyticus TaxID=2665665 RepID=A0ABW2PS17_9BACL
MENNAMTNNKTMTFAGNINAPNINAANVNVMHPGHHMGQMVLPYQIKTLNDCAASCEFLCHHLMCSCDIEQRVCQIELLHDCAEICTVTAKFMARCSPFTKHLCLLCAYICECCGNECCKFPDQESQMCGRMCLRCAQECREFAN